jgi:hypothetical protein
VAKPTIELRYNALRARRLALEDAVRRLNKVDHDYALRSIEHSIVALVRLQRELIRNHKQPEINHEAPYS